MYCPSVYLGLRLCGDQPANHCRIWPKPLSRLDIQSFLGFRQSVSRALLKAHCEVDLRYQQATPIEVLSLG